MEDCVFCKIIKGEIPSAKIWEDERYLAFLTISPINPGHTLVIPKKHVDDFFDLEDRELGEIMVISKKVAHALKKAFNPQSGKVGVMVAGLAVSHAHIHLIPMHGEKDLDFNKQKTDIPFSQIEENAQKIVDFLNS